MAGAYGWPFILFSVVFYCFLGFILFGLGAWNVLAGQLPGYTDTYLANGAGLSGANFLVVIWLILTNPLSAVGFISWLSTAFFIVDLFIVITDLIP